MKRYLILRNNEQNGPFTLEEMKWQQLKPMDLIWVEGESASWKYPTEIESLRDLVADEAIEESPIDSERKKKDKKVFVLLPFGHKKPTINQERNDTNTEHFKTEEVPLETKYVVSLDELKTKYAEQLEKKRYRFPISFARPSAIGIPALFIGLIFTAFLVKKLVGNAPGYASREEVISVAQPVAEGGMLNESSHNAAHYQNAITHEVVAADTIQNKSIRKMKPMNLRKMVSVKNSAYKVGLLGGINNLKLTVLNNSPHPLDKVAVSVDYLKPGGDVVKSEIFYFLNIAPKSTKTLSIPPSNRGVKVRSRIQKIESKQYQTAILQL